MTYDCISDCLGHDSIPEPPLSRRWRDSEAERWRNRGLVAQIHRSMQYYICRRYGGYLCVCVCVVGGQGGETRKFGMCTVHSCSALTQMVNYGYPEASRCYGFTQQTSRGCSLHRVADRLRGSVKGCLGPDESEKADKDLLESLGKAYFSQDVHWHVELENNAISLPSAEFRSIQVCSNIPRVHSLQAQVT